MHFYNREKETGGGKGSWAWIIVTERLKTRGHTGPIKGRWLVGKKRVKRIGSKERSSPE